MVASTLRNSEACVSAAGARIADVSLSSWMNVPSRLGPTRELSTEIDHLALMSHPAAWHEVVHMLLAAFAATGFLVAGIHAWLLARNPHSRFHRLALTKTQIAALPDTYDAVVKSKRFA